MVRSFLLQSLVREGSGAGDGWRWRLNLELLDRDLGELRGFPDPPPGATFDGPVLWIAGANSTYVLPEDRPHMDALFPGDPAGEDQERRPLGALRAARDLPGDAPEVPRRVERS